MYEPTHQDIASYHSLCFHGSEENRTGQPRLLVIGHDMPDGAHFTPSGKFQVFLRLLGPRPQPGMKFTEPVFPLVMRTKNFNRGLRGSHGYADAGYPRHPRHQRLIHP